MHLTKWNVSPWLSRPLPMRRAKVAYPQGEMRSAVDREARGCRLPASAQMENKMAGSVNKVILVGNLGRDPEIRSFSNGGRVANLSVATSETWRDKQSGERKEKTE